MTKFLITNAIPYVNAKPHIGHALEFVQSDVIRRFHISQGYDTALLCGGDENAIKNVQAAEQAKEPIQEFIDKNTKLFANLAQKLNIQFDFWQKGSTSNHHLASQKLWELCAQNGDIYKKTYRGLYCVGCELFYEKEELNKEGECFEHPGKKLEEVTEENYFFKLSNFEKQILNLIESDVIKITPIERKNEALAFVKQGLKDISISRSNERAKNWGVSVPNDPTQKIYVWFDALNIYQSGIGFATDDKLYKKWWPADLHVIGKGILRFHAIYWPAFLLSAKLSLPKAVFVHGYFTVNGQKMSKTLGNVIDPLDMIEKYGVDTLRYYLLREIPSTSDGDFSESRLKEVYNSDLANGLGNLMARVAKLCEQNKVNIGHKPACDHFETPVKIALEEYKFKDAMDFIWSKITDCDKEINQKKPWALKGKEANDVLTELTLQIQDIAYNLRPFLPETAKKIEEQFKGPKITSQPPLFPRI